MKNRWIEDIDRKCYLDEEGNKVVGFKTINGKRYYFDRFGVMQKELIKIEGTWFDFGKDGQLVG